jgi:hypothetical protein
LALASQFASHKQSSWMFTIDLIGGPGRTRTCNQTVMSERISTSFVDFVAFSFDFRSRLLRFDQVVSGAKLVR